MACRPGILNRRDCLLIITYAIMSAMRRAFSPIKLPAILCKKKSARGQNLRHVTFYFLDNSSMKPAWPKQGSKDPQLFASRVKKSLAAEVFTAEVEGQLMVIPMRNVKYMVVSPAPETLPAGIIRKGRIVT